MRAFVWGWWERGIVIPGWIDDEWCIEQASDRFWFDFCVFLAFILCECVCYFIIPHLMTYAQ